VFLDNVLFNLERLISWQPEDGRLAEARLRTR